mmetsp:Transcript_96455/g.287851  ORF Transcript_96455/g.287851 Transcript_96455/m.287851 type:complete len:194 (+) Transcript_96455:142-723(+)
MSDPSPAEPVTEATLLPGQRVMLAGLVGAKHLNGAVGRVVRYEEASGRYVVTVLREGSQKLFKQENVHALVRDQAALQAILESEPAVGKLFSLVKTGDLGLAELDDPNLCHLMRRLLRAGYWAEEPETMEDMTLDLDLAEHPSGPQAISIIKQLECSENVTSSLQQAGERVNADPGLRYIFDQLKARGHDFDF